MNFKNCKILYQYFVSEVAVAEARINIADFTRISSLAGLG
jgi:hypothetical protein